MSSMKETTYVIMLAVVCVKGNQDAVIPLLFERACVKNELKDWLVGSFQNVLPYSLQVERPYPISASVGKKSRCICIPQIVKLSNNRMIKVAVMAKSAFHDLVRTKWIRKKPGAILNIAAKPSKKPLM